MGELFKRIKRLAKKREVILLDEGGEDAVVIMPFDRYESLVDDSDFELEDSAFDFDDNFLAGDDDDDDIDDIRDDAKREDDFFAEPLREDKSAITDEDKELMKKVNDDIAKWRAEQKSTGVENTEKTPMAGAEAKNAQEDDESALTEEERYYLEPLE